MRTGRSTGVGVAQRARRRHQPLRRPVAHHPIRRHTHATRIRKIRRRSPRHHRLIRTVQRHRHTRRCLRRLRVGVHHLHARRAARRAHLPVRIDRHHRVRVRAGADERVGELGRIERGDRARHHTVAQHPIRGKTRSSGHRKVIGRLPCDLDRHARRRRRCGRRRSRRRGVGAARRSPHVHASDREVVGGRPSDHHIARLRAGRKVDRARSDVAGQEGGPHARLLGECRRGDPGLERAGRGEDPDVGELARAAIRPRCHGDRVDRPHAPQVGLPPRQTHVVRDGEGRVLVVERPRCVVPGAVQR